MQNAEDKAPASSEPTATKVASSSAKTATSSAKDEAVDWKSFNSATCAFSLKYPADWKVAKDVVNGVTLANLEALDNGYSLIAFDCSNSSNNISTYNKVKSYETNKATEVKPDYQIDNEMDTYTRLVDTKVDGNSAVRVKLDLGYKDAGVGDKYEVFIMKDSKIYTATVTYGLSLNEKVVLLDQILSTLKFL